MSGEDIDIYEQTRLSATPLVEGPLLTSPSIGRLVAALAKAKQSYGVVKKSLENPFYSTDEKKAMYADLSDIMEACEKPLAQNELVIMMWPATDIEKRRAGCDVWLAHSSGEFMHKTYMLPATRKVKEWAENRTYTWVEVFDAQTAGSAYTYTRRYGYQGIAGVAAEIDDDGNKVSVAEKGTKDAAQAVAQEKIKDLEKKLGKEATARVPKSTLEDELKHSVDATGNLPGLDEQDLRALGLERVMGIIQKVQRYHKKNGGVDYRVVDLLGMDPKDKAERVMTMFTFANHTYRDGTKFFDLLDKVGESVPKQKVPATFIVRNDGKGYQIKKAVTLGDVRLDELEAAHA